MGDPPTVHNATHTSADRRHRKFGSAPGARKRFLWLAQILFLAGVLAAAAAPRFVPGRILVKPKSGLAETEFAGKLGRHNAVTHRLLARLNIRIVALPEDEAEAALAELRNDPEIEFAERDYIAEAAFIPNDPYVVGGTEWHLARIQADQAWNVTTGLSNIVVAVLDSGVNAAHPDLAGQLVPGYDFVFNDSDPTDDFGHGTAVTGAVAAAGNNGSGVAGVAFGCRVLPVKVMDSSGFALYSTMAQGIRYAVDHGARVINISIAGSSASSTLQDAVNYAWSNNVVIVAAAGNNANNAPQYPAACDHVVAVSATEPDDSLAWFSSYGGDIALSAPGDDIWTTQRDPTNPYGSWRGTSFASPIVAGVAALVAAENPTLSGPEIISVLEQSADDRGVAGWDAAFGYGRVNAANAVSLAAALPGALPAQALPAPKTNQVANTDVVSTPSGFNSPLTVRTNGVGRVAPNLDGKWLEVGRSYSMKAVPGRGQAFAGWSEAPSQPALLTFTMQTNLVLTANFVPSPFPAVKGAYAGLVVDPKGVTPESSGGFRLAVTASGAFTGKLRLGGNGFGFRGQFDLGGNAIVQVKRGRLDPLTVMLHVDLTNASDQVAGSVTDGAWESELAGDRNVFNAKSNPAPQAGSQAFLLERADDTTTAATGSSAISRSGATQVKGKLNDGRRFSTGSLLARNGDCPFYLSLNRGSEVVIGWLNFPAAPMPTASGEVIWVRTGTNAFAATLRATSAP